MSIDQESSPWWTPGRHIDRKPFLQARTAISRALRDWFEDEGFVEVETGILQKSPGNETHLHAPVADLTSASGEKSTYFLRTSPEFACKKLLAAGEKQIVEFARVFRDRERGPLHLTEFTMLEWYRVGAGWRGLRFGSSRLSSCIKVGSRASPRVKPMALLVFSCLKLFRFLPRSLAFAPPASCSMPGTSEGWSCSYHWLWA